MGRSHLGKYEYSSKIAVAHGLCYFGAHLESGRNVYFCRVNASASTGSGYYKASTTTNKAVAGRSQALEGLGIHERQDLSHLPALSNCIAFFTFSYLSSYSASEKFSATPELEQDISSIGIATELCEE